MPLPPIFKIEFAPNEWLHIELSSATDMSFDVKIPPGTIQQGGYHQLVDDLCAIAPVLMRVDSDLAELYDSPWEENKPAAEDLATVQSFAQKYVFKNCNLGIDGFQEAGDER